MEISAKDIADWLKVLSLIPIAFFSRWLKMKISKAISETVSSIVLAQVMPMMQDILGKVDGVHHQVFPNGGKSMNDRLLQTLHSAERTEAGVHLLRQTVRAHQDADLTQARFETRQDGSIEWVSHALLRWCGRGIEQLRGWNWLNFVHQEDRDRVREEIETAVLHGSEWVSTFKMRDGLGNVFRIDSFAKPIVSKASSPEGWVGVFTKDCAPS